MTLVARLFIVLMSLSMAFMPGIGVAQDDEKIIRIGTGGINGVYYPAGGAICGLVKVTIKDHGVRCMVEPSGGSIHNLIGLRAGEIDIGIAQSDWHYNAYYGKNIFTEQGPNNELRALFSLHSEPFTVLVRGSSNIRSFDELKGHRISIGNQGSGMRATMEELMNVKGWDRSVFKQVLELSPTDQGHALCENRVDAIVFSGGHPNGLIHETTTECHARLIPVEGPEVDKLIKDNPYYAYAVIPGGMYNRNPNDTRTFGVKATLVTTTAMPDDVAYTVAKSVFENFDAFKTLHFVFATLDKERMLRDGRTAPFHDGALKYYRETGLIKE